jgi:hypothetical protein
VPYHSEFFGVDVRDEIAHEFTDRDGRVDDMMASLHEVRARLLESRSFALPSDKLPLRTALLMRRGTRHLRGQDLRTWVDKQPNINLAVAGK